ncbi:MAG: hypothetical protein ACRDXX_10940 [Stackebrandtia sp.]
MLSAKRRLRRDTIVVFASLAVPFIMTNPPVIVEVSDYSVDNPITLGLPTVWLWLQLWYGVMLVLLLVFALWLPSWRSHRLEQEVTQLPKRDWRDS